MWRVWSKLFGWDYVNVDSVLINIGNVRIWHRGYDPMITVYGASYPLANAPKYWKLTALTVGAKKAMDEVKK